MIDPEVTAAQNTATDAIGAISYGALQPKFAADHETVAMAIALISSVADHGDELVPMLEGWLHDNTEFSCAALAHVRRQAERARAEMAR